MKALIIGGTRNLGPSIAQALLEAGYSVAVFHRGVTPGAALPAAVERLHGDRGDPRQLAAALGRREFDAVVDTTLYNGTDARAVAELLQGRIGRYVMLSTGQVYLVRQGLRRPFVEEDYDGPTIPAPPEEDAFEYGNWRYGMDKRAAEDALATAKVPATFLRLPMINSERDHYDRIYGYLARLRDGGPIVIPDGPHLALRHVYGGDAVAAVMLALRNVGAAGRAYNISQTETVSIETFLEKLARSAGMPLRLVRVPRERLLAAGCLRNESHFSGTWMSELDNRRSVEELGTTYTPLDDYLQRLVAYHLAQPPRTPLGYETRAAELAI